MPRLLIVALNASSFVIATSRCEINTIMAASTSVSILFSVLSSSQPPTSSSIRSSKSSFVLSSKTIHLESCGVAAKSTCFAKNYKVTGYITKTFTTTSSFKTKAAKVEKDAPSVTQKDFFKLSYWFRYITSIKEIKFKAQKRWSLHGWKPRMPDMFGHSISLGKIIDNVYQQSFDIRSYEIQPDGRSSLEALINYLQETCIKQMKDIGHIDDFIYSTQETIKRNLLWVVIKFHVQVEHYPLCGDIIKVNTWITHPEKNTMLHHWKVHNLKTGQTILRAYSVMVLMNKTTRKLTKLVDEIKAELKPYCKENASILKDGNRKFNNLNVETANYVIAGLTPRWTDLDYNMHMNTVKYIGLILEAIPISMLETHEITKIVLEYKKECKMGNILQTLTNVSPFIDNSSLINNIECEHQLQLESGHVLMKGHTTWRPKV